MIRYPGSAKTKDKNGNEVTIPVHPSQVLSMQGPVLQVTVTQPRQVAKELTSENKPVKAKAVKALIDTGATFSVITPSLAAELGLIQTGFRDVASVNDQQKRPAFFAMILFPWGNGKEVSVAACDVKGVDCLIGRDILMHWNLIYNGADGSITICD